MDVISCLQNLCLIPKHSDVVFVVGEHNIPAHKIILASRSEVFEKMFYGSLAPKSDEPINIDDPRIRYLDFKAFIAFLYTDKVEIDGNNVCALMNLAKMYMMTNLFEMTGEFLIKNMTADNVISVVHSALMFENINAIQRGIEKIMSYDIMYTPNKFNQLDNVVLQMILKNDDGWSNKLEQNDILLNKLHPINNYGRRNSSMVQKKSNSYNGKINILERNIFLMVLEWGKNQCRQKSLPESPENLKEILKDNIPFIRFPLISVPDLIDFVRPTNLLDAEEMLDVMTISQTIQNNNTSYNYSGYQKQQEVDEFLNNTRFSIVQRKTKYY